MGESSLPPASAGDAADIASIDTQLPADQIAAAQARRTKDQLLQVQQSEAELAAAQLVEVKQLQHDIDQVVREAQQEACVKIAPLQERLAKLQAENARVALELKADRADIAAAVLLQEIEDEAAAKQHTAAKAKAKKAKKRKGKDPASGTPSKAQGGVAHAHSQGLSSPSSRHVQQPGQASPPLGHLNQHTLLVSSSIVQAPQSFAEVHQVDCQMDLNPGQAHHSSRPSHHSTRPSLTTSSDLDQKQEHVHASVGPSRSLDAGSPISSDRHSAHRPSSPALQASQASQTSLVHPATSYAQQSPGLSSNHTLGPVSRAWERPRHRKHMVGQQQSDRFWQANGAGASSAAPPACDAAQRQLHERSESERSGRTPSAGPGQAPQAAHPTRSNAQHGAAAVRPFASARTAAGARLQKATHTHQSVGMCVDLSVSLQKSSAKLQPMQGSTAA